MFALPLLLACIFLADAHMLMKFPPARGYKGNPVYPAIDYDLKDPILNGKLCKGKPPGAVAATLQAGQTIAVQFEGSARHGGGICQFAVSYDNDSTFYVVQEYVGGCPDDSFSWPVRLPANLPSCERCTFAWTWINSIGNREFYMNCADVRIVGGGPGRGIVGHPIDIANWPGHPTITPNVFYGGPQASGTVIKYYPIRAV